MPLEKEFAQFLDELEINKITAAQLSIMEQPVSKEEFKLAISHMKGNTAAGLDCFTSEFYKTFREELHNYSVKAKRMPPTWNKA